MSHSSPDGRVSVGYKCITQCGVANISGPYKTVSFISLIGLVWHIQFGCKGLPIVSAEVAMMEVADEIATTTWAMNGCVVIVLHVVMIPSLEGIHES